MGNKTVKASLLAVLLGASSAASAKCQLFINFTGYTPVTGSSELKPLDWMAVEEGKILAAGKGGKAERFSKCETVNLGGGYLLPGLIDAHGHVAGLGQEMMRVKLRGVSSEAEAVSKVKAFADKNTGASWILGRGWNQVLWLDKEFPTRKSLDATGISKPIFLNRIDGHAAWANSAALKIAGITRHTEDPAGGKIIRDADGEPTGVLIDTAMGMVYDKIPEPSSLEVEFAFDKAYEHLLSLGITSAHDAGIGQWEIDHYLSRMQQKRLPVRIYGMLSGSDPKLMDWLDKGHIGDQADMLSIRSVKLYSDGALGSRGAALLEPYSDDVDNRGLLITVPKDLNPLVEQIIKKDFQVNVHAIGDKGNRIVLDAYENAYKTVGGRDLRHRIEHSQIVSLADIPRFKELDIIASMQPTHATSDKNMAGDRLGEERLKGAYAWQKFIQQGTIIASGSDFPVELANAFHGLHAAITRQDHDNQPSGGWLPGERMTPAQALRSFTLDAAYSAHQDKVLGSLEPGKWADFILVDKDLVNGDAKQIWKTQVKQTWIAGTKRYDAAK